MYKHQVTVGNLAHETCRFKKCLRNTKKKHKKLHNELSLFFSFGRCAKNTKHTSAISLCSWSRIFKTTGIPLQLMGSLLNSSSSSLSPSPCTSSCAEKMFVLVPRPKCRPWLYIKKKKKTPTLEPSYVARNTASWKRRSRHSHLHNLPFLDWMES